MEKEIAKHIFPCYKNEQGEIIFDINSLPEQAKQQTIKNVYRFCLWGKIDREAFLCTYLTRDKICCKDLSPGYFATSCYGNEKNAIHHFICFSRSKPKAIIATGDITPDSGYSCPDKQLKKTKGSHINWWIFDDATPWEDFKEYNFE